MVYVKKINGIKYMNKETKKIVSLLGRNDWFDNVFMNVNTDMRSELPYLKDAEDIVLPNVEWIYKTTNSNIYFVGVSPDGVIRASADAFDEVLHLKEELYLVPFYLFSNSYLSNDLENLDFNELIRKLKKSSSSKIYLYIEDMIKYIEWYKEQEYFLYEYILKIEKFLKEQAELWKNKFEAIRKEEEKYKVELFETK